MKIGVDCSSIILQKTGLGVYASGLIDTLRGMSSGIRFIEYRPGGGDDLSTPKRIWWEGVSLGRKASADRVDVLYSPAFSPPPFGRFKKIVTVHDLIGLVYPQNVGAASRFYWSVWLPQALKRADRLVAISESTRRDIERFLKIPSQRVDLVPSAIRPHFRLLEDSARARRVLDRYDLSRPYFISVSTLEPRKNLLSLLRAYKKLRAKTKDPMLVLAGKPGGAEAELAAYIKENGLENDVKLLGYVTDEDVICLYNGALGFAMVSLYEGFGLPALEAMACGLTGVVSNASSLPEVVGQGAILVDPINVNEIAEGLFALCGNGSDKTELVRAARARAEDFSIEKVARAMIEIFKKEAGK